MPPKRKETGETSSASSSKRKKKQQQSSSRDEEEEDRISCLPDHILHCILSFLDMKDAVQTSILSKRWIDLWTSLGSLTLDSELFYSPKTEGCDGFLKFVDQVLLNSSNIDKFHLTNTYEKCEITSDRLYTWIISLIRRSKVQHLCIEIWGGGDGVRLPNRLFTCNSLTRLMLSLSGKERWSITLPAAPDSSSSSSMCLPSLWDLQLCSVSFHDEYLTNNFFLSCPNLKRLVLYDVEFLHMNLNISALKLETLDVDNYGQFYGYCHWPDTKFKLHAPNLSYFTCKDFLSKDYIMGNLPSLVEANIDMKVEEEEEVEVEVEVEVEEEEVEVEVEDQQHPAGLYSMLPVEKKQMYAQRMMQCLRALLSVKHLKLSGFLEVISGSPHVVERESIELLDLTCLRLETWLSVDTIRAIAYLLKISPNIKSLFLQISQMEFGSENVGDYLEAEMSLHCLLDKLEIVEIKGAVCCANELNFLQILLKNAKALKKLVFCTSTDPSPDRQKRFMKFTEKFLLFPRASSNVTIVFC